MIEVTFTSATTAQRFVRQFPLRPGVLTGCRFWRPERWIELAERIAKTSRPEQSAVALVRSKAKAGTYSITGVRCEKCGATLTALESVRAGIGPECQSK